MKHWQAKPSLESLFSSFPQTIQRVWYVIVVVWETYLVGNELCLCSDFFLDPQFFWWRTRLLQGQRLIRLLSRWVCLEKQEWCCKKLSEPICAKCLDSFYIWKIQLGDYQWGAQSKRYIESRILCQFCRVEPILWSVSESSRWWDLPHSCQGCWLSNKYPEWALLRE